MGAHVDHHARLPKLMENAMDQFNFVELVAAQDDLCNSYSFRSEQAFELGLDVHRLSPLLEVDVRTTMIALQNGKRIINPRGQDISNFLK
jgi:hypothetical protein